MALAAAAYIAILWWVFSTFLQQERPLAGAFPGSSDLTELALTGLLAWAPALGLSRSLRLPSETVVWSLYLLVYVPSIIVVDRLAGEDRLLPLGITLVGAMALLELAQRIPRRSLFGGALSPRRHGIAILAIGVIGSLLLIQQFGLDLNPPPLDAVYDTRAAYKVALADHALLGYLAPWLCYAVFPVLLSLGLRDRRFGLIAFGLAGEFLIYSITGFKSAVFVVLLVAAGHFAGRIVRAWRVDLRGWVVTVILAAGVAVTGFLSAIRSPGLTTLFTDRLIIVSGQLTAFYDDYFLRHPYFELRDSILRILGPSPYGQATPPSIIGPAYGVAVYANASVWADGIANFGLPGIIYFTVGLCGVLWILDAFTMHHDTAVLLGIGGIAGFVLCNTALLTAILSGGLGLLVVLVAVGRGTPEVPVRSPPLPP